ncbi:GNAT family N-acetyltransferase [Natronococcus sp. JC468]|uniref:GNAT family N-acetyltransferase n=1 Tax=Natronococcus sp. JC468 TaxID=1961921 RepID=UPI00143B26CA|nr:GNAT family N-acetyltransferase [Natronococcus sp. JC468]NKE38087.1 GNAT family N-acetyltransferase [Natronococcus sp. JC468]
MEELWLPYRRELGEVVESQGLSSEFDIETEIEWHIDRFETADSRLWVALDDVDDSTTPLEEIDAIFAGFISVDLETAPSAFDWPDRLVIGDFYVRELYRGAGLADQLVARAVQSAREDDISQRGNSGTSGYGRQLQQAYARIHGLKAVALRCAPYNPVNQWVASFPTL